MSRLSKGKEEFFTKVEHAVDYLLAVKEKGKAFDNACFDEARKIAGLLPEEKNGGVDYLLRDAIIYEGKAPLGRTVFNIEWAWDDYLANLRNRKVVIELRSDEAWAC